MIICERCTKKETCEFCPYDVECDTNFEDVRDKMCEEAAKRFGLEDEWVIAFCIICGTMPTDKRSNSAIKQLFDCKMSSKE